MIKTSKEVLMHAMQLAGVNNLNFISFFNVVSMTNNLYRRIYEKIATAEDSYYDCEYCFSGNRCELPSDVWTIKRVIRMRNGRETEDLKRQAGQTTIWGQYYLRNNELIINSDGMDDIKIIYAPQPKTLTIPDKPEIMHIDPNNIKTVFGMNDDEFWYEDVDGVGHTYNFRERTNTITQDVIRKAAKTEQPYCGGTFIFGPTYSWRDADGNVEDVTEILQQENTSGIKRVVISDPYLSVTYNDGYIKIFNGWCASDFNMYAYKGRNTLGDIIALCTNDYTGKGAVFHSSLDDKLYYSSFVPDTVLNYPEQADFSLLEMRLALYLAQMAGTNSTWLEEELGTVEKEFEAQLMRCKASTLRINNVRAGRVRFGRL